MSDQHSLSPTTTIQEDLVEHGRRRINLIWEITQAVISVMVVAANMAAGLFYVIYHPPGEYPIVLSGSLFLVVGFYFSRTNHTNIGGIGKPEAFGR